MTKQYIFYVELDGPICGIKQGSLELSDNPDVNAWDSALDEMAFDHVSSYLDPDEYEEENGCEMEAYGKAEAYDPGSHYHQVNGVCQYYDMLEKAKQDEQGRWYVEK